MPNSLMIEAERDLTSNPSSRLWASCPWNDIIEGRVPGHKGYADHYNFTRLRLSANINAAEAYWADGYNVFGSDGAAIATFDAQGGGATFSSDGDNEGAGIRDSGSPLQIAQTLEDLWFEVNLQTSEVGNTEHGWVVGLRTSTALTATAPIAADGTLADNNMILFHRAEGDGDNLDTAYRADGQTAVVVKADCLDGGTYGGGTVPSALVANTQTKLGLRYTRRGHKLGDYRLSYWVNGIELPDGYNVTSTAGNPFPNDVRLGRVFALLNATATTPGNTTLRWWRVAQLFAA